MLLFLILIDSPPQESSNNLPPSPPVVEVPSPSQEESTGANPIPGPPPPPEPISPQPKPIEVCPVNNTPTEISTTNLLETCQGCNCLKEKEKVAQVLYSGLCPSNTCSFQKIDQSPYSRFLNEIHLCTRSSFQTIGPCSDLVSKSNPAYKHFRQQLKKLPLESRNFLVSVSTSYMEAGTSHQPSLNNGYAVCHSMMVQKVIKNRFDNNFSLRHKPSQDLSDVALYPWQFAGSLYKNNTGSNYNNFKKNILHICTKHLDLQFKTNTLAYLLTPMADQLTTISPSAHKVSSIDHFVNDVIARKPPQWLRALKNVRIFCPPRVNQNISTHPPGTRSNYHLYYVK